MKRVERGGEEGEWWKRNEKNGERGERGGGLYEMYVMRAVR